MINIYFIVFALFFQFTSSTLNLLCSEEFCKNYLEQVECPEIGEACDPSNNKTSGEMFYSEDPCGCCHVCMEHIREGNYCTTGSPEMPPTMSLCGPGLICKLEEDKKDEYRCRRMDSTPCTQDQIKFDELKKANKIGKYMVRPECDGDGNYFPAKCNIGQTCFCVDKNGKRIFGEFMHSVKSHLMAKCECSRINDKFKFLNLEFKNPTKTTRCVENGDFDELQCIKDQCTCVEAASGFPYILKNYNMSLTNLVELPCFNKSLHLNHRYLHDCEYYQKLHLDDIHDSNNNGFHILYSENLNCQPDGWYQSINENRTNKFCVDPYNRLIENYIVPRESIDAKNMNCYCARTRYYLKNKKANILPKCCRNGNFESVQCRDKVCYCVDINGMQDGMELPEEQKMKLPCFNNRIIC